MQLRHLAMVNWHLFDIEDIPVLGHAGILGENRSGKSTVLDMIQTVLTGASKSYLRLNAVAGDSGRSRASGSRRSVHSYCLGALGEGETRREEAQTYVALGFGGEAGQPPVSIGLALGARRSDTVEEVYGRFVVIGKILTTVDFIEDRQGRRYPKHWDDVKAALAAEVGAGHVINERDRPIHYVREYMRRLVPALPSGEQNAASMLRAIVNAMTLNHGLSATEFVRRFILEDNPIRIGELRTSIDTYKSVSASIVTMRLKLEALKTISATLAAFEESGGRKALEAWIAKRARWLASRHANRAITARIAAARAHIEAEREDLQAVVELLAETEREIERLKGELAAHHAKTGRDDLDRLLRQANQQRDRHLSALARWQADAGALATLPRRLPLEPDEAAALATYVACVAELSPRAPSGPLQQAEAKLRDIAPALLERVTTARRSAAADVHGHQTAIAALRDRIAQGRQAGPGAYLDEGTRRLIRRLESAGLEARPLCDLVEITAADWAPAAEALLARDREAVFVARARIHEATRLFKEGRREFQGASLVSLNKLDPHRDAPRSGTLPAIFRSGDPDAMAFLQRRYGTVRLAETLDGFNEPGRALMKDGLYDDGLVRSHRRIPDELKVGRAAQAGLVERLQRQLTTLLEDYARADATEKELGYLVGALTAVPDAAEPPSVLAAQMAEEAEQRRDAESRIAAIEAEGDGGLRDRLKAQDGYRRLKTAERDAINERQAGYRTEVAIGERDLDKPESSEGSAMNLRLAGRLYASAREALPYATASAVYRERLARRTAGLDASLPPVARLARLADAHRAMGSAASEEAEKADKRQHAQEMQARGQLHAYFADPRFGTSAQVGPASDLVAEVKPWAALGIDDLERNEIRRHEARAREAAERASTLFRGEFVNALTQRMNKLKRDIDQLNRNLRDHPFHNERYSFHRTAEAEFQPVLQIVEIGQTSDDVFDLLFRADLPDNSPYKDTIRAVEQLLEDPDKDFSAFEDYRNFYTFEIHMEDVETGKKTRWETRRATGSGAEQQVPLYVAIGASLAAVYGSAGSAPGGARGMAPALFDEAFSKMDGRNQRQMMSFYEKLGLQVFIAAPMEKKAAIMEHMETIVEIDRIGEQSMAKAVHYGKKTREELLAINPEHMTDAEIARRMAAE